MLTLGALSGWEAAIQASIAGASGTLEERDRQIARAGLYGEYPALLGSYSELAARADDPAAALEALKRAVFLAWYSMVEPAPLTGIPVLAERLVREVFEQLASVLRTGAGDEELRWMLAWYASVFDYPFEYYAVAPHVERFVAGEDARAWTAHRGERGRFAARGLLGSYWSSLFASGA